MEAMDSGPDSRETRKRIDHLFTFLPYFERIGPDFRPQPLQGPAGGFSLVVQYPREVKDFFHFAAHPFWDDPRYDPRTVGRKIAKDKAIATASLDEIKSMLTYCVRGERFGEGHWGQMIREGRILAILRRLQALRDDLPADPE